MSSFEPFRRLQSRGRLADRTFENYVVAVKKFCKYTNVNNPDLCLKYIQDCADKEKLLNGWIDVLLKQLNSNSALLYCRGLRRWLDVNRVAINWFDVPFPRTANVRFDRIPTKRELRKILDHAPLRDKTFVLFALSSGIRTGTISSLVVGDVTFESDGLGRVNVENKPGRKIPSDYPSFYTFITPETVGFLEKYFEFRRECGEELNLGSPLFTSDRKHEMGMVLYREHLTKRWNRLLELANLDEKPASYHTLHVHVLRKFFETQCTNAGVRFEFREAWMAHTGRHLESSYFRADLKTHLEEYWKAVPYLTIYEATNEKEKIEKNEEKMAALEADNEVLRERLTKLEEQMRTMVLFSGP